MVMPAIMFGLIFFTPESPRWLVGKGRDEQARKALIRLRGSAYTQVLIAEEFAAMQAHHEAESMAGKEKPKFFDLFRGVDRRRTLLSVGVVAIHAGSGSQFLINYGMFNLCYECPF